MLKASLGSDCPPHPQTRAYLGQSPKTSSTLVQAFTHAQDLSFIRISYRGHMHLLADGHAQRRGTGSVISGAGNSVACGDAPGPAGPHARPSFGFSAYSAASLPASCPPPSAHHPPAAHALITRRGAKSPVLATKRQKERGFAVWRAKLLGPQAPQKISQRGLNYRRISPVSM
ncbi:hypothetical protein ABIB48_001536 [Arthrobacter sp. UYCu511]